MYIHTSRAAFYLLLFSLASFRKDIYTEQISCSCTRMWREMSSRSWALFFSRDSALQNLNPQTSRRAIWDPKPEAIGSPAEDIWSRMNEVSSASVAWRRQ